MTRALAVAALAALLGGCSPVLGLIVRAAESATAGEETIAVGERVEGSTRDAPDRWRPPCGAPDGGGDRAYALEVDEEGQYRLEVNARYDSVVALFDAEGRPIACNDDRGRTTHSMLEQALVPGRRYVVVVDGFRGATGDFELRVERVVPPAPDEMGEALAMGRWVRGDTRARGDGFTAPCGAQAGSPDQLWTFTPDEAGAYSFTVRARFDTVLAVYPPAGQGDEPLACNDDLRSPRLSRVELELSAGEPYRVVVDGARGESGEYAISVARRRVRRSPIRGVVAEGRGGSGDTSRAVDRRTFGCGTEAGSPDETWRFRAARDGAHTVRVDAEWDAAVAIYEHGGEAPLACGGDGAATDEVAVAAELRRGQVYELVVDGVAGASGPYTLSITPPPPTEAEREAEAQRALCRGLPRLGAGLRAGRFPEGDGESRPGCGRGDGPEVRYHVRFPRAARLLARVEGPARPTLELRRGCALDAEALECAAPARRAASVELSAELEADVDYVLVVDAPAGASGTFTLEASFEATP